VRLYIDDLVDAGFHIRVRLGKLLSSSVGRSVGKSSECSSP
jgi:hypothetical protein